MPSSRLKSPGVQRKEQPEIKLPRTVYRYALSPVLLEKIRNQKVNTIDALA